MVPALRSRADALEATAASQEPRIVCYHQTQWDGSHYVSMLPLSRGGRKTTHVIIAAIHLNENPGDVTLNDDPWTAEKNTRVWQEIKLLQQDGIKVLGASPANSGSFCVPSKTRKSLENMLGGAAKGSYARLDLPLGLLFRSYYDPLRDMIAATGLDGLDLDVEEWFSLEGIIRLIDQLRSDFGPAFIITLAPVCSAMQNKRHISGFNYEELEAARGSEVSFYNTQFYNGWGHVEDTSDFDRIMDRGWRADKIVIGVLTNPEAGRGWVPDEMFKETILAIRARYPRFGGVMGWEYFNSITVANPFGFPWSWSDLMTEILYPPEPGEEVR